MPRTGSEGTSGVSNYRTEAIVLRKVDYGEADRIITLLTRDRGKLAAVVKGARRSNSRLGPHLDSFACVDVMLASGRNLEVVTQVRQVTTTQPLRKDMIRAAHAAVIAELCDRILEDRSELAGLYQLARVALDSASLASAEQARRHLGYFLMQVLVLLGYRPQLGMCCNCQGTLPVAPARFDPGLGGLVCRRCPQAPGEAIAVGVHAIKALRLAADGNGDLFMRLRLAEPALREVELAVESHLSYHVGRRLKSLALWHQMQPRVVA